MTRHDSIREISTAADELPYLVESLVFAFAHDRTGHRFVLVCEYPKKALDSSRAFIALVFDGVENFTQTKDNHTRSNLFWERYQASERPPHIVLQEQHFSHAAPDGAFECWFGAGFGGLQFRHHGLRAFVRDARVQKGEDSFTYRDFKSGEEFDVLLPFGALDTWTLSQ
jgi:hypothetical protein